MTKIKAATLSGGYRHPILDLSPMENMMTAAAASIRSEITALAMGLGLLCAGTVALIGSIGLGAWILGI